MRSKAVVFTAPGAVEVAAVDVPEPGAGDVVVRTVASWISPGTEGSYLRGERIKGDTPWRPGDPTPFPIVAGYQKVGIVEHVGREATAVTDVVEGDIVFASVGRVGGAMFEPWGGHLELSVAPATEVWKLPPGLDPVAYAGLVLTQVGWNCGTRPPVRDGSTALVIGDGLVGQWAAQTLGSRGAKVVLAGRRDERLSRFTRGTPVNVRGGGLRAAIDAVGAPIDVLVDTAGDISSVEEAAAALAFEGHVVSAGFYGTNDRLALQMLRGFEATVHLPAGWTRPRMDDTLAAVADGRLETLPLITHRFPVDEAPAAWAALRDPAQQALGVILDWKDT